jgi:hypothetical protein
MHQSMFQTIYTHYQYCSFFSDLISSLFYAKLILLLIAPVAGSIIFKLYCTFFIYMWYVSYAILINVENVTARTNFFLVKSYKYDKDFQTL